MFLQLRVLIAICAFISLPALSQEAYPSRPIHLVIAQPGGTVMDAIARLLGERLTAEWKQPVVVEAKLGGLGAIAADYVAKAPADGHVLMIASSGIMAISPLVNKVNYSPDQFLPLAHLGSSANVLVVRSASSVRTPQGLVEKARTARGGIAYASMGPGSVSEAAIDAFVRQAGVPAVSVPYKAEPPAIIDLISGEFDFMAPGIGISLPHLKSGALVALAVTTGKRSSFLPDVPTMSELGYRDVNMSSWYGIYAPSGLPPNIASKITSAAKALFAEQATIAKLKVFALEAPSGDDLDFPAFTRGETAKWRQRLAK